MSTVVYIPEELTSAKRLVEPSYSTKAFGNVAERVRSISADEKRWAVLCAQDEEMYHELIKVEEFLLSVRRYKLRMYASAFYFVCLVWAAFGIAFYYAGLPYHPFVAVLIATLGIAVVVSMKLRDE